ncbi:large subunit GTPase 1 [Glugoides intestinalis]
MPPAKKKSGSFAALLIADRFSGKVKTKRCIQRNSITEFTPLSMLNERLTVESKIVRNSRHSLDEEPRLQEKYMELIESMDYSLSIPPRVQYKDIAAGEYKGVENSVFNRWKLLKGEAVFERNIEIWRQFWITCERATTIAQIVDARDPIAYLNEDILKMYPGKKHVILINKIDLVSDTNEAINKLKRALSYPVEVIAYSALRPVIDINFTGLVSLIGYPNVGKSSTINMILQQKKVRVSATPGKTKYIQTIETPNFTLLDCPGLVFPKHTKIVLVLMGILNIDQITDLSKYGNFIIDFAGVERLKAFYKLNDFKGDFLEAMSVQKGWVKSKCLRTIAKDVAMGEVKCHD